MNQPVMAPVRNSEIAKISEFLTDPKIGRFIGKFQDLAHNVQCRQDHFEPLTVDFGGRSFPAIDGQ